MSIEVNEVNEGKKEMAKVKKNLVAATATAGLVLTAFGAAASAEEPAYTVRPGDSLWKIAQTHHVSIKQLKEWNALSGDTIYVNQKLSLTYTVKKGDSLWKIAKENGTTVSELKRLNGMTSGFLQIGMQLKIAEADVSPSSYTIQKGDTLSEIGARFHLTVSQLKSMNQLSSDTIYAGKTLNVSSYAAGDSKQTAEAAAEASEETATVTSDAAAPAASSTPADETAAASGTTAEAAALAASSETAPAQAAKPAESSSSAAPAETATAELSAAASAAKPAESSATTAKPAAANSAPAQAAAPAAETAPVTSNSEAAQAPAASTETAQKPAAASASLVEDVIAEAKKYVGAPYKWAGNTPAGFDCSGFTKYVFAKVGITLPRTAATQWDAATPVSSPSVGDLVFFETYKVGPSHVGIYLGNNQFISAASSGVVISDMTSTYWKTRYLGAKSPY
ncbi:C40 family peptidase [Neobacillus muris]|uniref:C40 family peptidase n=1 Tax=Neobacillus muris TaxID=2941334 RepID=UPI00203D35E7|nr:C40 family peptidase [Neobacillus muris]